MTFITLVSSCIGATLDYTADTCDRVRFDILGRVQKKPLLNNIMLHTIVEHYKYGWETNTTGAVKEMYYL